MPGPKFFTPSANAPQRPAKSFSLREANRAIPYVNRIVKDIVHCHQQATNLQAAMEMGELKGNEAEQSLERYLDRLQELVDELHAVGCELKDYSVGLVDFIGRHQGRDVCLCWKLGETQVSHWHELQTGYAGRKSIDTLEED